MDNKEELYPEPCDTSNVTFSGTVFPIIKINCWACHSGSAPLGGFLLETYENISMHANIPVGQYGSLYGAISHANGNVPMPFQKDKLSDCTIQQIKIWIDDGAPNN